MPTNFFEKGLSCLKTPRMQYSLMTAGTTFDNVIDASQGVVVTRYILECGDTTSDRTRTLSFIDSNGVTVWSGAAHADAANYSIPIDVELLGKRYIARITLSGTTGDTVIIYDYLTLLAR